MARAVPGRDVLRAKPNVLFMYWGRRGLSRLALEVAHAASKSSEFSSHMSVSRQNESFQRFADLGPFVIPVTTFSSSAGVISSLWRAAAARQTLDSYLEANKPKAVIELMPHIWSSFVAPVFKRHGARYVTIVHDAHPHPGDYRSASAQRIMRRAVRLADDVLTLSEAVAGQLEATGDVPREHIHRCSIPT